MKKTIIVIAGHTGAGKSFTTKKLKDKLCLDTVYLSDLGILLPKSHLLARYKIEKLMLERIESILKNKELVIVDGLASFRLFNKLTSNHLVKTCFLDTPYKKRINRISHRENISYNQAVLLEQQIELQKSKTGLNKIIQHSDFIITDNNEVEFELLRKWIFEYEK